MVTQQMPQSKKINKDKIETAKTSPAAQHPKQERTFV